MGGFFAGGFWVILASRKSSEPEARLRSKHGVWRTGLQVLLLVGLALATTHARAEGAPAPSLWLSPLEIHFGSVPIGGRAQRAVDVRNLGNAPLTLSGGQVAGPFSLDYSTCAGEVAGGASCQIVYTFHPQSAGDFEASSSGTSDAGPWGVALRGRAASPEIQVSPRSLDFGRGPVEGNFPVQVVTITNIGGVPVGGFTAEPVSVPFTGGLGQCANGLAPGQSCHMTFDFVPLNPGVYRRVWTAQSDAGPIEIELQGRTYSGIEGTGQGVTPRGIDFGPVLLGSTVRQTVTFRNYDPSIPIVNWEYTWLSDEPALDFEYETDCGESLAGLATCELEISYRPRRFGPVHVILNVLNSQGIVDIHLWGQGAAAEIVADSPIIDLGMASGEPSDEQVVRFTNLGRGTADILGVQSAPSFAVVDSDCGDELAAGESCTAEVRFEPNGYGRREGTISLLTDDDTVPVRVLGGLMTPGLSVGFSPTMIPLMGLTRLRLTFVNDNTAQALFNVGIDGQLPEGLALVNGPPEYTPSCGAPTLAIGPTGTEFTVDEATLAAGQTCVIDLAARAVLAGGWRFDGAAFSHAGPSAAAGADVEVTNDDQEDLIHFYIPTVIKPGG